MALLPSALSVALLQIVASLFVNWKCRREDWPAHLSACQILTIFELLKPPLKQQILRKQGHAAI